MSSENSDTKEDVIYMIPRPESGEQISIDIFTSDTFKIMLSQCYRTMVSDNICICLNKKKIRFFLDGFFKKHDDIYFSLSINNKIQDNQNTYNIQPLLNGSPISTVEIFDKNKLERIKISGNWISNIYDTETEFIFNFTVEDDIYIYELSIDFDLNYIDGIHSDIPITSINEFNLDNIKYNITQYSSPHKKIEFYDIDNCNRSIE